eukprot:349942-Chlamydomonas_euryale.AAC.2
MLGATAAAARRAPYARLGETQVWGRVRPHIRRGPRRRPNKRTARCRARARTPRSTSLRRDLEIHYAISLLARRATAGGPRFAAKRIAARPHGRHSSG